MNILVEMFGCIFGICAIIGGLLYLFCKLIESYNEKKKKREEERLRERMRYAPLKTIEELNEEYNRAENEYLASKNKPASVTKRAIAGSIIGGVPGAIIGAATAIDENNKDKK